MRLFIAVNFSDDMKSSVMETAARLRKRAIKGSFTSRDNLHITVVFIGEIEPDRVQTIKDIMDSVSARAFNVTIGKLGAFKNRDGDLYWLGIGNAEKLADISGYLSRRLRKAGFDIEVRPFKPHLTIGRRVLLEKGFDWETFNFGVQEISCPVGRISLMLSERPNGKLTYTEIYGKEL